MNECFGESDILPTEFPNPCKKNEHIKKLIQRAFKKEVQNIVMKRGVFINFCHYNKD